MIHYTDHTNTNDTLRTGFLAFDKTLDLEHEPPKRETNRATSLSNGHIFIKLACRPFEKNVLTYVYASLRYYKGMMTSRLIVVIPEQFLYILPTAFF